MNGSTPGKEELELIERLDKAASEKTAALRGLGGWLILFQLRIYLGILLSIYILIAYRHDILFLIAFVITLAPIAVCMVLFYRKKLLFRTVYIVRAALGLACACIKHSLLFRDGCRRRDNSIRAVQLKPNQ